jgi:hypothetical protein
VLRTRTPLVIIVLLQHVTVQLACIKPAASVHPEPGSNSPLYIISFALSGLISFFCVCPELCYLLLKDLAGYLLLISICSKNFFPLLSAHHCASSFGIAKVLPFF